MSKMSYKLHIQKGSMDVPRNETTYTRDELMEMTTFQLRNICYKEKLVGSVVNNLDREGLLNTILRFRSAEESLFIESDTTGGFERIEAALHAYLNTPLPGADSIKIPAKMSLYAGLAVDRLDGYRVESAQGLAESNVLLVNDCMELCGIFQLRKEADKQGRYMLFSHKDVPWRKTVNQSYSLLFFRKQDSDYLYKAYTEDKPLPPVNLHYYKVPVTDLEIRELEETDAVLAIDFGTSSTTAGAFLDHQYVSAPSSNDLLNGRIKLNAINYVAFPDTTQKTEEWIEVLPTVVQVADCSVAQDVRYHIGYEALRQMKKNGYSSHATVFFGLKRWVNSYHKLEEVMDSQGNTAMVKRSDILRQYLLHVIQTAEHQFKCRFRHLHITSPVKLKTQFIEMFTDILPEYRIESQDALDEGMAVLFNTIADQIDKDSFLDGETYQALVIDCGGGTTDLSSCRFRIEDGHISYRIDISTTYENGDTNFGGNNITYRIMQFMKIVFADYYSKGRHVTDIDQLIDIPGSEIFRHVDEFGVDAVYEQFERRYREAEALLPTCYKAYENKSRDDYQRVRNNFHFLWDLADHMKKEFFRQTGILRNRFTAEGEQRQEQDLKLTAVERWVLSIREDGRFRDVYDLPDVVFNSKEINHLIKADIYEILRVFLDDFYQEGKLADFSIIKLTGQSCRIDVFREALKEFVPGRSIEFRQRSEDAGKVPDLKLSCLRGALRYQSAKKAGFIEAQITNHAPVVPYSVTAFTHNRQERILIRSQEKLSQVHGAISRPYGVSEVEFFLKESDGLLRKRYLYTDDRSAYKPVLYEEIQAKYASHIPQEETDSIQNGEVKFFVFSGGSEWGFHVVPVARQNEQLLLGKKVFFAFESDLSELDFFDGMK
ncbi:molecular chaperone [Brevibacillus parabrevis]|uniref:molecular chaperone n=1 Tax=Brevibacillus parabrevis TaxID=54914 RepID=UPI002E1D5670|nr:molecular chaperone [Brevibacillus parabrevis]